MDVQIYGYADPPKGKLPKRNPINFTGGYRGGDEGDASPPAYSNFLHVKNIANI